MTPTALLILESLAAAQKHLQAARDNCDDPVLHGAIFMADRDLQKLVGKVVMQFANGEERT